MRQSLFVFFGIAIAAAVAVGILAVSFDPYQTTLTVKALFFTGLAIILASIIGMAYCGAIMVISRFKKS